MSTEGAPTNPGGVIDLERTYWGTDMHVTDHRDVAGMPLQLTAGVSYDNLDEAPARVSQFHRRRSSASRARCAAMRPISSMISTSTCRRSGIRGDRWRVDRRRAQQRGERELAQSPASARRRRRQRRALQRDQSGRGRRPTARPRRSTSMHPTAEGSRRRR